jgi:hypothetical protein
VVIWLRQHGGPHLFYLLLIVGGAFAFHSWLAEHDARIAAENAVTQTKAQISSVNAAAESKVKVVTQIVTRIIHDKATPAQVVAAVPTLTDVPLNARVAPDSSVQVSVDALPLVEVLGEARTDAIELKACQDVSLLKDSEIKALKKKPAFWHRVGGVAKAVGIGVGIGILLGAKL